MSGGAQRAGGAPILPSSPREGGISPFRLEIDRATATPLVEQIRAAIEHAIEAGVLAPESRLPSWRALATQLGVARGTVRAAYERLADAQLIVSTRARGTCVAERPAMEPAPNASQDLDALPSNYPDHATIPSLFQMGVPAADGFPSTLLARLHTRAVRSESMFPSTYPDPRGEPDLRREIAAQLAIARGVRCRPSQIFITSGFAGGLGLALHVLGLTGSRAWVEDPGYPMSRRALEIAGLRLAPVPVDHDGLNVEYGVRTAGDAAVALVTPGQQAPLGATLSLARRLQLLDWAAEAKAWIFEDDYLGELQLDGRAAPALASLDRAGRVIHFGSFSKTVSPTLRVGFVMTPPSLAARFAEAAACLAPAPGAAVQMTLSRFMAEGHYLRHLRRMKRLYAARRDALRTLLHRLDLTAQTAGLALLVDLPDEAGDVRISRDALAFGMAPAPLSPWYADVQTSRRGLLLNVATAHGRRLPADCERLRGLIWSPPRSE